MNLLYIGIFIYYTYIMKIHTYKWPTDRIPLNAVPFYKDDSAEFIEEKLNELKRQTRDATDFFDMSTFWPRKLTQEYLDFREEPLRKIRWDEYMDAIKKCNENGTVYTIHTIYDELDMYLTLLTFTKQNNNLIVYAIRPTGIASNISYRGFLKLLNEKFKELWYNEVAYYFPIAHTLKPDLSREDYDRIVKLWATDDFMGYRCYIKKLR